MKKHLLKIALVLFVSGLFSACAEEEINPSDNLNAKNSTGVTKEDGGF